jgi:hypothetical protein
MQVQVQPRAEASTSTPLDCDPAAQLRTRSMSTAERSKCERGHKRAESIGRLFCVSDVFMI